VSGASRSPDSGVRRRACRSTRTASVVVDSRLDDFTADIVLTDGARREGRQEIQAEPAARGSSHDHSLDVDTQFDFSSPTEAVRPGAGGPDARDEASGRRARAGGTCTSPPPTTTSSPTRRSRQTRLRHDVSAALLRGTRGARQDSRDRTGRPGAPALESVPDRYLEGREFLCSRRASTSSRTPHAERLLERLDPHEIVVFGVATDVCDDATIRGLLLEGSRCASSRTRPEVWATSAWRSPTTSWREQGVDSPARR